MHPAGINPSLPISCYDICLPVLLFEGKGGKAKKKTAQPGGVGALQMVWVLCAVTADGCITALLQHRQPVQQSTFLFPKVKERRRENHRRTLCQYSLAAINIVLLWNAVNEVFAENEPREYTTLLPGEQSHTPSPVFGINLHSFPVNAGLSLVSSDKKEPIPTLCHLFTPEEAEHWYRHFLSQITALGKQN